MSRPKSRDKIYMGGRYAIDIATKFNTLSRAHGVSIREALRRLMVQAILSGQIPGLDTFELEEREHAKWGAATPTVDGENKSQRQSDGKVVQMPPAE